jgi:MOSC domain-containing protein YiiM
MGRGVVVQLNISSGGLPKKPVPAATLDRLGIQGDKHLYRLHGGPRKALLLMAAEFIDTLAAEGFLVCYGALGENVTTRGLPHHTWQPAQRYRLGSALIELTELRAPCRKLDPFGAGIQKRIRGVAGFYAAVLQGGRIQPGDTIQLVDPVVTYALA